MNARIALGLLACLIIAAPARADLTSDWMEGKLTKPLASGGKPVELKFGHPSPPASLVPPVWRAGMEQVAIASGRSLHFKEYGGGTLIGPRDGFKAVRTGVAEWAACFSQYEGRSLALSKVFELPLVSPQNPMVTSRIAQELAKKYFAPEYAKQGAAWGGSGFLTPTNVMSRRPVRKIDDLRGMKIVAQGFAPEAARALGATLVNIPFPEIYTALQQGLVDAVFWVDAGFVPYKVFEVAKYHTTIGLTGGAVSHCYSREWFRKLTPEQQKAFYLVQEPLGLAISKVTALDYAKTARAIYEKSGIEMITLPESEFAILRARMQPVVDKWAEDLEKEGLPARALLADIRKLEAKYAQLSPDALMKLALESPVMGIE